MGIHLSVVSTQDAVSRIEKKVDLLVKENPEDVMSMLQIINNKLDAIKKDVEFTYQKTSALRILWWNNWKKN